MMMVNFVTVVEIFVVGFMIGGVIGMILMACMSADRGDDDEDKV